MKLRTIVLGIAAVIAISAILVTVLVVEGISAFSVVSGTLVRNVVASASPFLATVPPASPTDVRLDIPVPGGSPSPLSPDVGPSSIPSPTGTTYVYGYAVTHAAVLSGSDVNGTATSASFESSLEAEYTLKAYAGQNFNLTLSSRMTATAAARAQK